MVVCADSERALASATDLFVWWRIRHSSSAMVVWTRARVCGGAALLPRATQRPVELCGHDSAVPRCMAHSASWPSIDLAGLICNWISMGPSNVAIVIRWSYLAAPKAQRKFWPSPPPPWAKSVMLGGGSDPPSTKSVMLGGGSGVSPFRPPPALLVSFIWGVFKCKRWRA